MKSQNNRVKQWLETGKPITQFEAMQNLGIMRLASRINDLRNQGCKIEKKLVTAENRFGEKCRVAQYRLVNSD